MNQEEIRRVNSRLRSIAREHNLGWVIDQVDEEILTGKLTQTEATTYKESSEQGSFFGHSFRPGSKTNLLTSIEYSDEEKLKLLLDATEQAAVNVTFMAHETVTLLAELPGAEDLSDIKFLSEDNEEDLSISLREVSARRESAGRLSELLRELRARIDEE